MFEVLRIVQLVLAIALLALAGQGALYLLAGAQRSRNIFYQLLQIVAKPFTGLVGRITPRQVGDHQVPVVTFFLLLIAYAVVFLELIKLCARVGMEACK